MPTSNPRLSAAEVRRAPGEIERRCVASRPDVRGGDTTGSGFFVRGYAALFNSPTSFRDFEEVIEPRAFDQVLSDDVRALFNHDANLILARTKSKTLRIGVDTRGLWYEFEAPDTSFARDLIVSMRRGDVDQSSFAFVVAEERWSSQAGTPRRHIVKLARLFDVSPVTYPAYPTTSATIVSLPGARSRPPLSILRARLELAALD